MPLAVEVPRQRHMQMLARCTDIGNRLLLLLHLFTKAAPALSLCCALLGKRFC